MIPDPPGGLTPYREACRRAIEKQTSGEVSTTWDHDVLTSADPADPLPSEPDWAGHTVFTDIREHDGGASPEAVWRVIEGIGGANGWYSWPLAWKIRGVWDKAVGGAGLNRGRRLPDTLRIGDPVDWWRVDELEPNSRLLLRAEMKVSGYAWLDFEVQDSDGDCNYRQTATFIPSGVRGRLYWGLVAPFHRFIFPAMAKNIAAAARRRAQSDSAFIRS